MEEEEEEEEIGSVVVRSNDEMKEIMNAALDLYFHPSRFTSEAVRVARHIANGFKARPLREYENLYRVAIVCTLLYFTYYGFSIMPIVRLQRIKRRRVLVDPVSSVPQNWKDAVEEIQLTNENPFHERAAYELILRGQLHNLVLFHKRSQSPDEREFVAIHFWPYISGVQAGPGARIDSKITMRLLKKTNGLCYPLYLLTMLENLFSFKIRVAQGNLRRFRPPMEGTLDYPQSRILVSDPTDRSLDQTQSSSST